MFHFGLCGRLIMAFQAKRFAGAHEQFFVRRVVRIMTRIALAVFRRLVLDLEAGHEILVAPETDLA